MKRFVTAAVLLMSIPIQNVWADIQSYSINELLDSRYHHVKVGDDIQLSDEDGALGLIKVTAIRYRGDRKQISLTLNKDGLVYPGSLLLIDHKSVIFSRQDSNGIIQTIYRDGKKIETTQQPAPLIEDNHRQSDSPLEARRVKTSSEISYQSSELEESIIFGDVVQVDSSEKLKSVHRHDKIKMAVVYDDSSKKLLASQGFGDIDVPLSLVQAFYDASSTDTEFEFIPIHFNGEFPVAHDTGRTELEYAISTSHSFADKLFGAEPDFIHTITNNSNGDFSGVANYGIRYDEDNVGGYVVPAYLALGLTKAASFSGGLVTAHEMGHQLGLNHDRYTLAYNPKIGARGEQYDHAIPYGYDAINGGFYTIMSYGEECQQKSVINCQWLGLFSNPQQMYSGVSVGLSEENINAADSAKWLRLVHGDVAVRKNNPIDIQVFHEENGVRYVWPNIADRYALITDLCDGLDDATSAAAHLNNDDSYSYLKMITGSSNSAWLKNEVIARTVGCISLYAIIHDESINRNYVVKLSDLPSPSVSYTVNGLKNATLNVSPMVIDLPEIGEAKEVNVKLDGEHDGVEQDSDQLLVRLPQNCGSDSYCPSWPISYPRAASIDYPTLFSDLLDVKVRKLDSENFVVEFTNKASSIEQWRKTLLSMMQEHGIYGVDNEIVKNRLIPIKIESYREVADESNPYYFDNRQATINISIENLIPDGSLLGNYIRNTNIYPNAPLIAQLQGEESDDISVYINGNQVSVDKEVSGNIIRIYGLNDIMGANAIAQLTIARGDASVTADITTPEMLNVDFDSTSYAVKPGSLISIWPISSESVAGMSIISSPSYVRVVDNRYLEISPPQSTASGKEKIELEITDINGYKSTRELEVSIASSVSESSGGGGSMSWVALIIMLTGALCRRRYWSLTR